MEDMTEASNQAMGPTSEENVVKRTMNASHQVSQVMSHNLKIGLFWQSTSRNKAIKPDKKKGN
jgi:hypothetical protein